MANHHQLADSLRPTAELLSGQRRALGLARLARCRTVSGKPSSRQIKVTNYLLDKQLGHLEEAVVREGGLRERTTRARLVEPAKGGRA
jgi:four helix bundle suffix protein